MKRNRVLFPLTVFLLVAVFLLTFYLHYEGTREVISDFQGDQLSYAKHLSNRIYSYLQARSRGLRTLSSFAAFQHGNAGQQRVQIQTYAKQLEEVYVKAVSLYNKNGTVVYSTDPRVIGVEERWSNFFVWAQKKENRGKTFLSPLLLEPQSFLFILATPIFQGAGDFRGPGTDAEFLGVLTFTLDMKGLLAHRASITDPTMNLDRLWIVDKNGTLLLQPDHPEMVFRNIYQSEGNCQQCHASFRHVEEILRKGQGSLDYQIKDNPKKIAAYASVEFENASWVVVVNTPYDKVTGFVKKSLRNHLFLLAIIVMAFAVGSMIVIRDERIKIRAEEKVLRWLGKMAERRKAEEALQQERNKLKGILDAMNDGVHIVNRAYEVLYTNPALENELGPGEGRKCYEYLFDQAGVCAWCKIQKVFGGETVRWEGHSSKTGKTYELFDAPFVGPDGTLCKLGISRDITERKKAEEALRESEKQLRVLSTQLLRAQETERKRISRELHDELGQSLMVMKLRLDFIDKNLLAHQTRLKRECADGVQYVDQVMENIRRLSRDLSPTILEDFGLSAALRWLINNFAERYNIKVVMDMIDIDALLPPRSHVVVYRTVQEALTNIGKHSAAQNVSISIRGNGDSILFSIADDGIGFNESLMDAKGPEGRGLGLETMKGRCQMVGGVLTIWSQEGQGTRITLSVPVEGGESSNGPLLDHTGG